MLAVRHLRMFGWGVLLTTVVILTNRVTQLDTDRKLISAAAGDSYSYLAIARAAPGLPSERVAFHHGQRMVVPYVLGMAANLTPMSLHAWFRIAVVLIELSIIAVFCSTLGGLSIGASQSRLVLAMLILNPWGFRETLTFPELVNDLGFVLGLTILVRGLLMGRTWNVLAGQLIASVCRQTGLLLAPMALLWLWRKTGHWARISPLQRSWTCAAIAAIAVGIYSLTSMIAATFSSPDMNAAYVVDGIRWLRNDFSATEAAKHLLSVIVSLIVALALFAVGWIHRRGPGADRVALLLFGSACIWAQPFLSGPTVLGGNGERLSTLALVPLLSATALVVRDAGLFSETQSRRDHALAIAVLLVMSLHHLYSARWTPFAGERTHFEIAYALGALMVAAIAIINSRDAARPTEEAETSRP